MIIPLGKCYSSYECYEMDYEYCTTSIRECTYYHDKCYYFPIGVTTKQANYYKCVSGSGCISGCCSNKYCRDCVSDGLEAGIIVAIVVPVVIVIIIIIFICICCKMRRRRKMLDLTQSEHQQQNISSQQINQLAIQPQINQQQFAQQQMILQQNQQMMYGAQQYPMPQQEMMFLQSPQTMYFAQQQQLPQQQQMIHQMTPSSQVANPVIINCKVDAPVKQ